MNRSTDTLSREKFTKHKCKIETDPEGKKLPKRKLAEYTVMSSTGYVTDYEGKREFLGTGRCYSVFNNETKRTHPLEPTFGWFWK
jgi:hypothetical protein